MFESIFYPSWSGERFTPADEVFTDFAVPHVAECILGKTAFLTPRFKHHAKAFAVLQIRLDLPTDSGEVTAMQFDTILWEVHASPPQRSNVGCKISQVHFCICDWLKGVLIVVCTLSPLKAQKSPELFRLR